MYRAWWPLMLCIVLPLVASGEQGEKPAQEPANKELEKHWLNLRSNPEKAFGSLGAFIKVKANAVQFLKRKLKPSVAVKPERIRQLIQNLESKDDMKRQAASGALVKLRDEAKPYLRKALAGQISDRLCSGIKQVFIQLEKRTPTPDELRVRRAIEILERIGSKEARLLLQKLASGSPAARQTREAQAALERLAKQKGDGS